LEQDADAVEFTYRPEYYGLDEDEQGNSLKNILVHIIGKNRHGAGGDVKSIVDLETQRVMNIEETDISLLPSACDRYEAKKELEKEAIPYGSAKLMSAAKADMTPEELLPF
jgi:replicative DNA helicase